MPNTTTPDSSATPAPSAAHKPFSWLDRSLQHDARGKFAATTFDICQGISLCVEMVHSSDLTRLHNSDADPGEEDTPTLDVVDTDRLLRFAKVSAELLASHAERQIEWMNNAARRQQVEVSEGGAA